MDKEREDQDGFNVTAERQQELREAIGDAPLYVLANLLAQQVRPRCVFVGSRSPLLTADPCLLPRSSSAGRCT